MFRIIDNKKVEMTQDESDLYDKICQSYSTSTMKGSDLFIDLFEADDNGVIVFLKPPSKRRTTLEIFLFLMSLMQHQHLRQMSNILNESIKEMKETLESLQNANK